MIGEGLEHVYMLTVISLGLLPGIPAFFLYRFTNIWIRIIPTFLVVAAAVWATSCRAHQYDTFSLAAVVYAGICVFALLLKTKKNKTAFRKEFHFDWLAVLAIPLVSIVFWLLGVNLG